jgi:hypothetical protein
MILPYSIFAIIKSCGEVFVQESLCRISYIEFHMFAQSRGYLDVKDKWIVEIMLPSISVSIDFDLDNWLRSISDDEFRVYGCGSYYLPDWVKKNKDVFHHNCVLAAKKYIEKAMKNAK